MAWILNLQSCCTMDDTFCTDQVFTETVNVPMKFTYVVNSSKPFIEAKKITATNIKNALKVEGEDFKVTKVELISANIQYSKDATNESRTFYVNVGAAVTGGVIDLVLLKENQVLPLFDVPATIFNKAIKINDYLNGDAIKELKKIVQNYATIINEGDISFILRGEGLPSKSLVKFTLNFELNFSVSYEVCRYAPMGVGERPCE
jgi:hypothetical protein